MYNIKLQCLNTNLKVDGWYSTNILGNRDGLTLSSPKNAETKITSKSKLLGSILGMIIVNIRCIFIINQGDNKRLGIILILLAGLSSDANESELAR